MKLVECVPNFSEGRERAVIDAISGAIQNVSDVKLLDVEFPDDEKVSEGQADINFYQKGYSDMAIIHIENSDNERFSFAIEPFLSRVRWYQANVGFQD